MCNRVFSLEARWALRSSARFLSRCLSSLVFCTLCFAERLIVEDLVADEVVGGPSRWSLIVVADSGVGYSALLQEDNTTNAIATTDRAIENFSQVNFWPAM